MSELALMGARATAWHTEKFPNAQMANVTLKVVEETGEVAEAVNHLIGRNSATAKVGTGVPAEAADVAITLMVLLGRWFPDVDLGDEINKKLLLLETPGAHKSSKEVS